jgi:hypothetical protein
MADNVGFKVEGFDSLRSQLREATMEAQKLSQQFGQFSPQALEAAQKVADIKDQIDDVNGSINALTGAGKIQAFGKAVGTIAGGFTAAQGALALFGGESEDLQKTLVKLQGAMALSQGLAALEDAGQAFSNLGVAAVDTFRKISAAIAANPWGALAIAIGAAAAALAVYALSADEATEQTLAFDKAQQEVYKSTAGDIVQLRILQRLLNSTNTSQKERKNVLEQLDKLLPGFNQKNKDQNLTQAELNQLILDEIENIKKRAKAKAAESELERIELEKLKIQQEVSRITKGEFTFGENVLNFLAKGVNPLYGYALPKLKSLGTEMEKLNKQTEFYMDFIDKGGLTPLKPGGDGGGGETDPPKGIKKITEAYIGYNSELEKNLGLAKERAKLTVETFKPKDVLEEVSVSGVVGAGKPTTTIVQVVQDEEAKAKQIADVRAGARQFELNKEKEYYDKLTEYLANYKVKDKENLAEFTKFKEEKLAEAALFTEFYQRRETLIYEENFAEIEKIEKEFADKRETKRKEDLAKEQAALEKKQNEEALALREQFNNGIITEEEFKAKQLEQEKQFLRDKIALLEKYNEDASALKLQLAEKERGVDKKTLEESLEANQEKINAAISSAQVLVDAVGSIYAAQQAKELKDAGDNKVKQEEINKKYFEKNKKVEIANAIISTLRGALDAFTTSLKLDPTGILGGILAAAALAGGYAQVAKIRNTPYPESDSGAKGSKFQNGGLIRGASHEQGGIRSAVGELEGGEFIMNRNSTSAFLPLLEAMNSMGNGNQMRYGGQSPVIKTYVVASEMSSQQEANKRISDLARI